MPRRLGRRRICIGAGVLLAAAVGVALALTTDGETAGPHGAIAGLSTARSIPKNALRLTVGAPLHVHPIRPGFLGLSIEFPSIESYAGTDPSAINPVLVQLIRNIAPNQSPVLRIGGDSTDWEWWPVAHMKRPGGVHYNLTPTWIAVLKSLTQQLNARLILGIDLEANSIPIATAEANHLVDGIGRSYIQALEPGNEPELYGSWAWYRAADGRPVKGRPSSWDISDYERQLHTLHKALHPSPIAGPATGGPKWTTELPQFLATASPYLRLLTIHRYPLQLCYTPRNSPVYPSIANLLSAHASRGLATGVAKYIRDAHARGIPVRVDEMNTNSCGSAPGVTKSFASALWATDALFAMAGAGADGVNIHTYQGSSYELFAFDRTRGAWRARVEPEYYGLYLFALAAPPNSRLLNVRGPGTQALSTWATSAPDGHTRITLINDDVRHSKTAAIKLPGAATTATLLKLVARKGAPTIAGSSFGRTGTPSGHQRLYAIAPTRGNYVVTLPPASAALLVR